MIFIVTFLVLIAITVSFFLWQINIKEKKLEDIENQVSMTLDIVESKNKQITDYHSSTSV